MTLSEFLLAHVNLANSTSFYGLVAVAAILCVGAHFGRQPDR